MRLSPWLKLTVSRSIDPGLDLDHFLEDLQNLGAAVGLGLQGVGFGKANVNLLPLSLRLQSILRTKRWAAIAILAILPLAFWASYKIKTDYMVANYELQKRIELQVKANDKNEKAARSN